MNRQIAAAGLAAATLLSAARATPARAHAVAGARVFPVTLTFDDPGVADEASVPTFSYQLPISSAQRLGRRHRADPSKRRLVRSIAVQAGFGVLIVLVAGLLASLPPSMHT